MPSLIAKHQEKVTVTKVKKAYSEFQQAFNLARNEYGDLDTWFGSDRAENSQIFYDRLSPYLKITKYCGHDKGCWTNGYIKNINGNDYSEYDKINTDIRLILSNGTAVLFFIPGNSAYLAQINIDIDGMKGPYTFGKDVFVFEAYNNRIIPSGSAETATLNTFDNACLLKNSTNRENGYACAAWVIFNENMDYLKCNDLSWDGPSKCK